MTLAEAQAELAKVNASIDRITGTASEGGAQDYSLGQTRIVRAQLETLYKRKKELEVICSRLDTGAGGGACHYPIFQTRR